MAGKIILSGIVLSLLFVTTGFVFERESFGRAFDRLFPEQTEEEAIRSAVVMYNKIFSDIHASDGMTQTLNQFPASKALRHELYKNLGFLRRDNLILIYDMADISFREVTRTSPHRAEVLAFEEWNYLYQRPLLRDTARGIKGMGQGFRYFLEKKRGGWIVVDYSPADLDQEPKNKVAH